MHGVLSVLVLFGVSFDVSVGPSANVGLPLPYPS